MSDKMNDVDRIAKAMCGLGWNDASDQIRNVWRGKARTALRTLREPSNMMRCWLGAHWGRKTWAEFQNMIDLILMEKPVCQRKNRYLQE